jgi:hypothetical protein
VLLEEQFGYVIHVGLQGSFTLVVSGQFAFGLVALSGGFLPDSGRGEGKEGAADTSPYDA